MLYIWQRRIERYEQQESYQSDFTFSFAQQFSCDCSCHVYGACRTFRDRVVCGSISPGLLQYLQRGSLPALFLPLQIRTYPSGLCVHPSGGGSVCEPGRVLRRMGLRTVLFSVFHSTYNRFFRMLPVYRQQKMDHRFIAVAALCGLRASLYRKC